MTTDHENPLDIFRTKFGDRRHLHIDQQSVERLPEQVAIDIDQCNTIGAQHALSGDFARAEECFLAVLKADPTHAKGWCNLGFVWQSTGHFDDALRCYMNSYNIDPNDARNLTNLGFLHSDMGLVDHAIRFFEKALEIEPGQARAEANLGRMYLSKHDYAHGWPLLEARFRTNPKIAIMREYAHMPVWDGKPCKRLAIWPEQGVGDQILYTTMLPTLIERGQDFVVEIDARLLPAYHRSFPTGRFIASQKGIQPPFEDCDAHISMMSLCQHLRPSIESFSTSGDDPILVESAARVAELRHAMGPREGKRRVAISWRSFHPAIGISKQTQKSATLADFAPLGARDDLQLVPVQYGNVASELSAWAGPNPLWIPNVDLFNDIDGVLAVIAACDVVVTTSNVTAHFAGALGKDTILIYRNGVAPFHYWEQVDGRSLWYPSVRIVTGEGLRTWPDVMALVNEFI